MAQADSTIPCHSLPDELMGVGIPQFCTPSFAGCVGAAVVRIQSLRPVEQLGYGSIGRCVCQGFTQVDARRPLQIIGLGAGRRVQAYVDDRDGTEFAVKSVLLSDPETAKVHTVV